MFNYYFAIYKSIFCVLILLTFLSYFIFLFNKNICISLPFSLQANKANLSHSRTSHKVRTWSIVLYLIILGHLDET